MRSMTALTHREIIEFWPNSAEFARAIGTSTSIGRMMRLRSTIPPRYFRAVMVALVEAGYPALTYAQLHEGLPEGHRDRKRSTRHAGRDLVVGQ